MVGGGRPFLPEIFLNGLAPLKTVTFNQYSLVAPHLLKKFNYNYQEFHYRLSNEPKMNSIHSL